MTNLLELKPTIEVEGVGTFDNIEAYRIDADYLTPTDDWEITVYDNDDPAQLRRTFRPLRPIKLYLGDRLQIVGRIDAVEGTGDGQRSLRVRGRDYLADVVDGNIDPSFRIKQSESLGDVIQLAFAPWGIETTVGNFDSMRNATTGRSPYTGKPARDFLALTVEDAKPDKNQGAFEWGSALAARHGATMQPSTKRNEICLCEPEYRQSPLYSLTRVRSGGGNIESGVAHRDWTDLPTVVSVSGRAVASGTKAAGLALGMPTFGPGSPSKLYENKEIQAILSGPHGGPAVVDELFGKDSKPRSSYDSTAPCYRPMFYEDKKSKNSEQIGRGLRRMLSERVRKTLMYEVELQGVADRETEAIYGLDTIATVTDEIEDVDEPLWIFGRTLSQQRGSGPTTQLQLIRPGSFVL